MQTPKTEQKNSTGKVFSVYGEGFTPSKSYMHEKKRFQFQVKQKCDRVKIFHRSASVWETDPFLRANNYKHSQSSLVSREGRKLNLADFNSKFKDTIQIKRQVISMTHLLL